MKRGLIEEQGKGGWEACCCLIQWDAPGVWTLAHFNCTPHLWKGVSSNGGLMNLQEKAGYSAPPSHTVEHNEIVLVRPTCFWHRIVALAWQLNTQMQQQELLVSKIKMQRIDVKGGKKKNEGMTGNSKICSKLSFTFSGIRSIIARRACC